MRENAIECRGGLVPLPPGHQDWLPLVFGDADQARTADGAEVLVHYADAVDPEWVHCPPGVNRARVPLTRPQNPTAIRLPDRPGVWIHIEEAAA
ncbi:hypothetical protein LZP81_32560 [Streptomyces parvulus]|uniref:Uncharacterized protein n=1 Tax=Streptomyces parvulus TaxID=146923 RepID=A0A191V9W1_9ACTN|nr:MULTISPECIES: hypothetical protein [Streptomyces]ANJ11814.1 hypothetical protein Spa2297_32320 [Streptomyces parvulus]MCC9158664.1 hypothetical protein [Streptomyces parvulus]MCE7691584.1 hypothetical protein [Streptomyces parvulus]MCQ4192498.1 hypothetical protein [Streptomyces parvulus]MZD58687.1 hypothetical protein [Streptomyces sp. SID5606]